MPGTRPGTIRSAAVICAIVSIIGGGIHAGAQALDDTYDRIVGAIADLRAIENPDRSVRDTLTELEQQLERINIEVAEHDPEQDQTDTGVVAHQRAREALADTVDTLNARAAAKAELAHPGISSDLLDESVAETERAADRRTRRERRRTASR